MTLNLLESDRQFRWCDEYTPDFVFYDDSAYQYSHTKNDTAYYLKVGNATAFANPASDPITNPES